MEIRSLIILAAKADSEGNFRVADRLTAKIETMSREASYNYGGVFRSFVESLPGVVKKTPGGPPTGFKEYAGYFIPDSQYAQVQAAGKVARNRNKIPAGQQPPGQQAAGTAAPGTAAPGTGANSGSGTASVSAPNSPGNTLNNTNTVSPIFNIGGGGPQVKPPKNGRNGKNGIDGKDGAQGIQGLKGDTGPEGPAGKWWPGVVAGLLGGAIGTGGVAAWLASKGADSASISQIEDRLDNHFKANQLSARTQAGQMDNQQAAQDFIESRRGNPKFNTAQDFYYEAQRMGYPPSMMNSIAALAKAEGFQDLTRFQD